MKQSNSKSGQISPKITETARDLEKTKVHKNSEASQTPTKIVESKATEPSIVNKND